MMQWIVNVMKEEFVQNVIWHYFAKYHMTQRFAKYLTQEKRTYIIRNPIKNLKDETIIFKKSSWKN